jgi:hypothetical protein
LRVPPEPPFESQYMAAAAPSIASGTVSMITKGPMKLSN